MLKINIAVDGPAGAGKSTAAKGVASRLGLKYLDTGAMYRAITWKAILEGIDFEQPLKVANLAAKTLLSVEKGPEGSNLIYVDGVNVTREIRTPVVNQNVSLVARIPEVRRIMVAQQQKIAQDSSVVMDGRDIGTNVLPYADLKFFLTASLEERAHRRYLELKEQGYNVILEEVVKEIAMRDKIDKERQTSPLIEAEDAILINTTYMDIEGVIAEMINYVNKLKVGRI